MDSEVEIKFSIPQEIIQNLAKLPKSKGFSGNDICSLLGQSAFLEWANWLTGDQRHSTIPDLEAKRFLTIYDEILTSELPTPSELSSVFYLVPSRAEYIAHTIRYQHPQWWRKRLIEVAIFDCNNHSIQKGDVIVKTHPECQVIFDTIFQNLHDNEDLVIIKGKRKAGTIQYILGQDHLNAVIAALVKERDTLAVG